MSGPIARVFDIVDRTIKEDQSSDDIAADPKDPTVAARSEGYIEGWRNARADFRRQINEALVGMAGDPYYLEVAPDWQGIYITHGRSLMSRLDDGGGSIVPTSLTAIERRIMVARLRAWADAFADDEVQP